MSELTKLDEEELERSLIWIIASRRSGTSWLSGELLSYNTKFWDEPLIGLHIAGIQGLNSTYYRLLDQPERNDYFFCEKYKSNWIYYLKKLILERIYAQFKDVSTKIIIKEPNGSDAADILSECFPNSKFIFLLRDGRDVLNSNLAQISKGGFAVRTKKILQPLSDENRLTHIKIRSQRWVKLIDFLLTAYNQRDEKLRYLVKYENLRSDTFNELKKLYEFIEIKINDDELKNIVEKYTFENLPEEKKGIGTQKQFARVGIWKENFSSKEIKLIEKIMGNTLKKLGYAL